MRGVLLLLLFVAGCATDDIFTIEGNVHSGTGANDKLSCYCQHGAYIATDDGDYAACFEEKVSCKYIHAEARWQTKSIIPSSTSTCRPGEMSFYNILSYECVYPGIDVPDQTCEENSDCKPACPVGCINKEEKFVTPKDISCEPIECECFGNTCKRAT